MSRKPKSSSSFVENELERVEQQFEAFNENVKELTQDFMNKAPKLEQEQQTKLSQKEIEKAPKNWLKPKRSLIGVDPKSGKTEQFNERFRADYNFQKEYVHFIAENKEIIGESLDLWTKPFPGVPAEQWNVPVNTPVWGPRYLAEQIKRCSYHKLIMKDNPVETTGVGTIYGHMVAENTVQRLDAHPVSERKSVFMGTGTFN